MKRDGDVCRQSPRRCCPNYEGCVSELRRRLFTRNEFELHKDRRVRPLRVFHLRLSERGLRAGAPIHGLLRLIHEALLHELAECADDVRLVARREREIRILPRAEHAQPLELPALDINVFARERLGAAADFRGLQAALLLHHLELDRQPVAVPARHERRAEAEHRARLHHEVLQNLVQRRAHVDVAIRKRRPVVQHEKRCADPRIENLLIQPRRLPLREPLGFALHEIGLHREVRLWQQQGVFVIGAHS